MAICATGAPGGSITIILFAKSALSQIGAQVSPFPPLSRPGTVLVVARAPWIGGLVGIGKISDCTPRI